MYKNAFGDNVSWHKEATSREHHAGRVPEASYAFRCGHRIRKRLARRSIARRTPTIGPAGSCQWAQLCSAARNGISAGLERETADPHKPLHQKMRSSPQCDQKRAPLGRPLARGRVEPSRRITNPSGRSCPVQRSRVAHHAISHPMNAEARLDRYEAGSQALLCGTAADQQPSSFTGAVCLSAAALFIAPTVPGEAGC